MKPFSRATQTMFGSLRIRRQKSLAPGGARDVDDRAEPAVDLRDEKGERERARAEKHHRLEHVGPHDRLHAAGRDVDDRDDHEDGDRRQERPVHQMGHRDRRHGESHPRPGQPRHEEEDRRGHLARLPEAMAEELVDRRHVVPVEGGDEQERHAQLGEARAHEELRVFPVLAVGGRRHRDDRHGADLGGQERQAGRPPRDPAPREEEIERVVLLAREQPADRQQDEQRADQHRVIRPGEHDSF
jgi:hypothetical protein